MAAIFKGIATDHVMEVFALLGAPARIFGRFPLVSRYMWSGLARPWYSHPYAKKRWGKSYRLRAWLLFDMLELQMIERLINEAPDKRVEEFRKHQLDSMNTVSVVTALVAGIAVTALQLPSIDEVSYLARGLFSIALVISLLATFFTCLQQRTYGFVEEPGAIRAWLSNGVRYTDYDGRDVFQSSAVSHNLLQAPFEFLCISITSFLVGFAVYLGSAWRQNLGLGLASEQAIGPLGVLIAFIVGAGFALALLGQVLGTKDIERNRFWELNPEGNINTAAAGVAVTPSIEVHPTQGFRRTGTGQREASDSKTVEETVTVPANGVGETEKTNASSLEQALRRAAQAHREAAAADQEVARWLEIMVKSHDHG